VGKGDVDPVILLVIAGVNLALLIWFIISINGIRAELREIAAYTRRTALALPLTSGQAKLLNRSFTPAELVAVVEKQGGRIRIERLESFQGIMVDVVVIDNRGGMDPELAGLVDLRARDVIAHLKATGGHA